MKMSLKKNNIIKALALALILLNVLSLSAFAEVGDKKADTAEILKNSPSCLICAYAPKAATLDEIKDGAEKGADMICVTLTDETTLDSGVKLSDVFGVLGEDAMLLIKAPWETHDGLYTFLKEQSLLGRAVLMFNTKNAQLFEWLGTLSEKPLVFSSYKGTVIWNSSSAINKSAEAGVSGIVLKSGNVYSTTFMRSLVTKCRANMRAVIDMTEPKSCGKRTDTDAFWDDVTSRGFSVVITNELDGFLLYKQRVELERSKLAALTAEFENENISTSAKVAAKNYNFALTEAQNAVKYEYSAKLFDEKYAALESAYNVIGDPEKGAKGNLTVTPGRIIAGVIVAVGFVFTEYLFEHLKKKKEAERRAAAKK